MPTSRVPTDLRTVDELLDALAGGCRQSFHALYDQLAGPLLAQIGERLSDPDVARPVLWGTFVEVARLARRRDRSVDARHWISCIAARRTEDRARLAGERPADEAMAHLVRTQQEGHRIELAGLLSDAPAEVLIRNRRTVRLRSALNPHSGLQ